MKTIHELLSYLQSLNVKLWAVGDRLRYKAPRGVLTDELRDQLQENKTEILMFLHKAEDSAPVRPVPREGDMPLSLAQQRIWFLCQLEKETSVYNESFAFRLTGALNIAVLEQSLTEIIRRHEILRTIFPVTDGSPVQAIVPAQSASLSLVDITDSPENEHDTEMQQLLTKETQRPFDLERGPLLRITLIRLGMTKHLLLITMHHIIFDGWSMGIFNWELSVLYKAFSSGRPSPLPDMSAQYADFAHWQWQWVQGDVLQTELDYWKQQLANAPPLLELPTNRPRPPVQTFQGCTERFQLGSELTQRLRYLNQSGTTLFMTLLAAFATLLARYTGHDDIVIGSPIAGRNSIETESLMGFFVNTLTLRIDLSDNPVFQDLLTRVREVTVGAYDHQDIPFERLVEALQPERNLSHTPIFQVMFALQNAPAPVLELPGLTVTPEEVESGTAKFDLTLFLTETGQGLKGAFEYNSDLFDRDTITRMIGHFQTLLEAVASDPDQRITDMPLLTETELHQMIIEWNDTKIDYPPDKCIHQLFEIQAERMPDAIAVIFEDEELTYSELNRRSNQLAHYLQQGLGVGPEVLVGICLERSLEMVVGLIGILKAGGAYVPLDPAFPETRLAFMLEDTRVSVLLTQKQLAEKLPIHETHVLFLDTEWDMIAEESEDNPGRRAVGDNLAYVIYTSGSTGKPKGVQIPHRALSNFLLSMQQCPGMVKHDVLLAVTTLSFDIAALELFLPLIAGARVVLADHETVIDGVKLADQITKHGVTVMQATPATWRLLLESGWKGKNMLKALCGGEAFPPGLANRLTKQVGFLWNMYGPTETTIWSGVCKVEAEDSLIPIGLPIANTSFYVLDVYLNPVPVGVPGELYIGGSGLARGYLNRPELTAEKFVTNPFSREPEEACLYRTGDLVRYLPDGKIEFLGRIDFQIKIRGFRIELGEIETILGQHPGVQETVVLARDDPSGEKRLVSYIVRSQTSAPDIEELQSFLKKKLPDYMIPSTFMFLDIFPLTPNGKTDRSALPTPDKTRPGLKEAFAAPSTPVEDLLADIWADVLQIERVGIHDNFFKLGGHSLLGTRIITRIRQTFRVELSLRSLFEAPTIADMAQYIEVINWTMSSLEKKQSSRIITDNQRKGGII
ncbi:MAG: amino acid adenylation domain-containing protein [Desulfobacteraceae bacterium]|nr:amino acid adenylation domain-containing protein [Desulfobacteraceae bacterium]